MVLDGDELQTWLPEHVLVSDVSLKNGWGQRDIPLAENYWRPLEDLTRMFLDQSPNHVAVVEAYVGYEPELIPKDSVARLSHFVCDSVVNHGTRSAAGLHQVDVYGYLSGAGQSMEQVADFIEEASPFHQIIALISPKSPMPPSGGRAEKAFLTELAQSVEYIAIGAYDGLGVILWKRPSGRS
jgi:hypothetical protein